MADARSRHQLQYRVQHAQSRTQHGHDDDVARYLSSGRQLQRRLNGHLARRDVAQCLGGQQDADAPRRPTELFGRRARVAQGDQRVLDERVGDEMDRHG